MVHNRQLKLTAPTLHCVVPLCIAPCLVHLVGSAVVERDPVFELDDDRQREKSLCTRQLYNYARRYTYKAAPNGYTVVELAIRLLLRWKHIPATRLSAYALIDTSVDMLFGSDSLLNPDNGVNH